MKKESLKVGGVLEADPNLQSGNTWDIPGLADYGQLTLDENMLDSAEADYSPEEDLEKKRREYIESVVKDDYQLRGELGRGAFGVVYSALDKKTKEMVALKTVVALNPGDTTVSFKLSLSKFKKEIELLRKVKSENVLQVKDSQFFEDGGYVALEYIPEGIDLEKIITGYDFPLSKKMDILQGATLGLAAMHEQGIVHKDFKPANILVEYDGNGVTGKVGDLGLAVDQEYQDIVKSFRERDAEKIIKEFEVTRELRAEEYELEKKLRKASNPSDKIELENDLSIVRAEIRPYQQEVLVKLRGLRSVSGTPYFTSPEQVNGKEVDSKSDIFSLGVIIYKSVTGEIPFKKPETTAKSNRFNRKIKSRVEQIQNNQEKLNEALEKGDDPKSSFLKSEISKLSTEVGILKSVESANSLYAVIKNAKFIPPIKVNNDISSELNKLILKMLSRNPEDRPTAIEVNEELVKIKRKRVSLEKLRRAEKDNIEKAKMDEARQKMKKTFDTSEKKFEVKGVLKEGESNFEIKGVRKKESLWSKAKKKTGGFFGKLFGGK